MKKSTASQQHICLKVSGRVQGVGFRPYVYQLATRLNLKGSVCNTPMGVTIYLQGDLSTIDDFEQQLTTNPPVLARIKSIKNNNQPLENYSGFEILESKPLERLTSFTPFKKVDNNYQISPDIGLCEHCLAEFNDPENRRYLDPFINCSDCGPRYTVMHSLPYDRQRSSMSDFDLCHACSTEYHNPLYRRYHTQGICCPDCGPKISLYDAKQLPIAEGSEAIKKVAEVLNSAGIVAFKGMGGFHILCDASNDIAVEKLRQRKRRNKKPLAVLCANIEMALQQGDISPYEQTLFASEISPIMLFPKNPSSILSDLIAPDTNQVGLFLAHTPLQQLLFKYFDKPLVATSANISGDPILYEVDDVFDSLCRPDFELVDYVLDYNRDIVNPCDDSVVQTVAGTSVILRLGRGLAPHYGDLKLPESSNNQTMSKANKSRKSKPNLAVLAVGAQQKSSIAIGYSNQWMLSPYIGDLTSLASEQRFDQTFHRLQNLTQSLFKEVTSDAHPDYASSKWAVEFCQRNRWPLIKVPHHYAHVLACMAEFQLSGEPLLAFSWDGSGLGDDGTIWGGEVFLSSDQECYRVDHLRTFKLLGGDIANQQPRRIALSLLFDLMPVKTVLELDIPSIKAFSEFEIHQLYKSHQSGLNTPESSSMARMFDAVASLIGLLQNSDYEGQSGLMLERLYDSSITSAYNFENHDGIIDLQPMLWQIIEDMEHGISQSEMASQFINMLVNLIESISDRLVGFPVMVTGGVFQNRTLLSLLCERFEYRPQPFYFQQHTPINDGSIALGQLWWAMHNDSKS
ncbi:MAG: hydrogenase maturation protein HypF [Thiomicrorhabdus sp.]|nr:MAG: hydrogenase maturation protein HypF [Thiomicrorhabdus sp.]